MLDICKEENRFKFSITSFVCEVSVGKDTETAKVYNVQKKTFQMDSTTRIYKHTSYT